ncbi:hypothetical protein GGQ73_004552 [Rhizobium skierniewicense]|uniref:Uncharacterized protein n=1 Tax=Rhizobium skierniewicense TaxID=984260 RepID=A0A7W6CCJ3_9HYPH|nr:hypothetical protein [Rhizobium skierniewicense]MBB3948564.1 hypothetical protein [Rhizobium skierniewicense]
MLPPVSAVSLANLSSSTSAPRSETPQPAKVAPVIPPEPADIPPIDTDANIRAVSGELRLSQNVSVLAETLGKLMNIARMDGETAETYVNRLVASLQTIPADQKAMLEKALGSILRGISIDMLANILKSSSGPEAARLAIMFELSRSSPSQNAPKPTITPYLQDMVPESRIILPQIKSAGTLPPATSATTLAPQSELDVVLGMPVKTDPAIVNQPGSPSLGASDKTMPIPAPNPNSSGKADPLPSNAGTAQIRPPSPSQMGMADLPPATTDGEITTQLPAPLKTQSQTAATLPLHANLDAEEGNTNARAPQPPIPQMSERATMSSVTTAFAGATAKDLERLLLALAARKLPAQADIMAPLAPLLASLNIDSDQTEKLPLRSAMASNTHPDAVKSDAALTDIRAETAVMQRAAIAHDVKAAMLDQPMLQGAAAAMVAKDGIPLPFVNYPAAGDEPESDAPPRGRWPSSEEQASEGDDHQDPREQGTDQEQQPPANDEVVDHSVSEGANDDGSTRNAESYYLRMSGIS